MPILTNIPPPLGDRISNVRRPEYGKGQQDPQEGLPSDTWADFFTAQQAALAAASTRVAAVAALDQTASIGTTDMTGGTLNAGLYRLDIYAVVIQAGLVADLTVDFTWTYRSVSCSNTLAKLDGTVLGSIVGPSFLINVDGAPVNYTATYASGGPPVFIYDMFLILSKVQA